MLAKLLKLQVIRLRIWRRVRHKYLTVNELAMLDDLTVAEVLMIARVHKYVEGYK